MKNIAKFFISLLLISQLTPTSVIAEENKITASPTSLRNHLNYRKMDLTVKVKSIRAGNQDESGLNKYFFTLKFIGKVAKATAEEKEEKKLELAGEQFGQVEIKSLDVWQEDRKAGAVADIKVTGHQLREFVSSVMKKFKAEEEDISVEIEITHFESNKQFIFFGEDQEIGKVTFSPIPKKGSFTKIRKNISLEIAGDKSTKVSIDILYDHTVSDTVISSKKKKPKS